MPLVAALMAVPLPFKMPVMLVDSVSAGVAPPLEVPANPLLETTLMDVTYVPAGCLLLNVFQSVEVK